MLKDGRGAARRQVSAAGRRMLPKRYRIGKQSQPFVGHPKIAVAADSDRIGSAVLTSCAIISRAPETANLLVCACAALARDGYPAIE